VPVGQFGGLVTVDRGEIEALRSVQGLIADYCDRPQRRPLNVAVFGPPGSGKSFGVEQIAAAARPGRIAVRTFNLSQFGHPGELHGALHQVRDVGLTGKVPLVFWDEFDTSLAGEPLGWLRYFLAPMQDGSFQEGQITHPLGRAIFVFAGGTAPQFAAFGRGLGDAEQRRAKLPDFVSRLKGFLDVLGPNRQPRDGDADPYHVVRRAILLRSLLERHAPALFHDVQGRRRLDIDDGVLRALLETRAYRHGVRSLESILAMSRLLGGTSFARSALPGEAQLDLHVDGLEFLALVQEIVLTDDVVERLAEAAHRVYCEGKRRDGWTLGQRKCDTARTHPLLRPYAELDEVHKQANRVNVRNIPRKLAVAGYVMVPARSNELALEFPGDDLETLARFEHELWMEALLAGGYRPGAAATDGAPRHEHLVPWEELPDAVKQVDRDLVRGIPVVLREAGYAVVPLRPAEA
jgi:hypothetical protein